MNVITDTLTSFVDIYSTEVNGPRAVAVGMAIGILFFLV